MFPSITNQPTIMRILLGISFLFLFTQCSPNLAPYQEKAKSWEKEVSQLEIKDKTESYPENALLCIGSSSFRLWKSIQDDMAPYTCINRGYGGAKFTDLAFFTDRLIAPHTYQGVMVFVANDITGSADDLTPEEVVTWFQRVEKSIRKKSPTTPIFLIEITPTESRWKVWNQIQEANSLLKAYCAKKKNLHFISTATAFLGPDGNPRSELFIQDKLHLNAAGYKIWASQLKAGLAPVVNP